MIHGAPWYSFISFCIVALTELGIQDRRPICMKDLIEPAPPTELTQASPPQDGENNGRSESSAKIDQLVHLLQLIPTTEKSLVFSQFTGFLDKVCADRCFIVAETHIGQRLS